MKYVLLPLIVLSIAALGFLSCQGALNLAGQGSVSGSGSGMGNLAGAAAGCPNLMNIQAIGNVNFVKEFSMDKKAAAKLEAALKASAHLRGISKKVDKDLKKACGNIAKDLGEKPGNSAKSACEAAARGIKKFKAKAKGRFVLKIEPPKCTSSLEVMADCAASCDANIQPGSVDVQCEGGQLSGQCSAKCKGTCQIQGSAKCKGTCKGSCTAGFKGSCAGKCDGKCDGKSTNGSVDCEGRCEGKCSAGAEGKCSGQCKGECKIQGSASCNGTCSGSCSVEMQAPKCEGEVKPPQMSAECKAECDAQVNGNIKCTKPRITVKVVGAADAQAAGKLVATLKANLPVILKISMGMKKALVAASGDVKVIVKGVKSSLKAMVDGSAEKAVRLTACVADPFKAALDAAGKISINVKASVSVQASATAGASTN